ncbi:hypothetical protein TPHA_0O01980 [Tetrapisispora phaffii CBS 4417]|uniref:Rho-GAP domain-containing protein n=1 Tax=Tetrapisispora phaffii (strain ATCC 24235 / CBS 4417 / NBRC 1672 / NRRL Y-8282 / UCD 70-5) TaxID=1071381 RepID=G8C1Y6_TETPH|nr:hypothetical protein TPHA_0O01980 [Tetrapisispora phaffii CBS 4417]CCE66164.1 hypothetical protein TPHA_0O01980 [Tetrapisispora phaffii CBS 4417]
MQNFSTSSQLVNNHDHACVNILSQKDTNPISNNNNNNNNNHVHNKTSVDNRKFCERCKKPIIQGDKKGKSTLKALGKYYHDECFNCEDCNTPLKRKYFPFTLKNENTTILLCQYDYFKRNELLCAVCDQPLRGLYYTAFGKKYDEKHFSCVICSEPCGIKKCFIDNEKLYCKYHFLKFHSKLCNGCEYPISDQYIEFLKGDEVNCWHPECYGIHKYWHVTLSSEKLALPEIKKILSSELDNNTDDDIDSLKRDLDAKMNIFNNLLSKVWSTLYKFEEQTAACISDMFQHLASIDQIKGLESCALLVLKTECLFKALGTLDNEIPTDENEDNTTIEEYQDKNFSLRKISKNLTTKIMIYLQILRKINLDPATIKSQMPTFMSIITGLAHFLKLIMRYGLFVVLEKNKITNSNTPLMKYLKALRKYEEYSSQPFNYIKLSIKVTDNCYQCNKYIQEGCIKYHDKRWHAKCFNCFKCNNHIGLDELSDATFNQQQNTILCGNCSIEDPISTSGFQYVTRLIQLIFLLKIGLVKSKAVTEMQLKYNKNSNKSTVNEAVMMQQTYIRTLNDISKLKSKRESVSVSHKQNARLSMLLTTTDENTEEPTITLEDKLISSGNEENNTKVSFLPENVFSNGRSLTLDDISRIVAVEQARELRPNAFTHFKKLKETDEESVRVVAKESGSFYSELSNSDSLILQAIALSLLQNEKSMEKLMVPSTLIPSIPKGDKSNSSNKFWNIIKIKRNKETKKKKIKKTFGVPLDYLCESWGIQSDLGVGPSKIQIPIVVDELIFSLRQMDLSVEGIFRINGNIRKLNELTLEIDNNPGKTPDFSKETAIQLSALLKKFIRSLPEPLMSRELYDMWINAARIESETEKRKFMSLLYSILPVYNRNVLEVLLSFLFWTSSFSHIENQMGSKMDIHNLSTVIAPNILYNGSGDNNIPLKSASTNMDTKHNTYRDAFAQNEGENYFLAIEVVDYVITNNIELAMVPRFLIRLLEEVKQLNYTDYESIKRFVLEKINSGAIEFDIDQQPLRSETVKTVHSSTIIHVKE